MRDYLITRYSFDELNPAAREKAIETERRLAWENIDDHYLSEYLSEALTRELTGQEWGEGEPNDLKLAYSLSYSQGDGVSFTGRITREQGPALNWPEAAAYIEFIRTDSRYSHPYTVRPEFYDETGEEIGSDAEIKTLRAQYLEICDTLERLGYKSMEYDTSEAVAIETLTEAGDIFLESGAISQPVGLAPMISLA